MKQIWTSRAVQVAVKYGEHTPAAAVCCNACRTCATTNLAAAGLGAALAIGAGISRLFEACAQAELSLWQSTVGSRDEATRPAVAYDLGMLKRLLSFLRLRRGSSPEDEQARAEAKRLREDMETLRTGAMTGSSDYLLYGGRESRRGQDASGD